jgi:predicted permease
MSFLDWIANLRARFRLLGGFSNRTAQDADLDDEMYFHIEKATERNIRRGMSPAHARRAALVAFGGRAQWTEAARDEQRSRWLDDFLRDLRYGAAALRRNPAFSASAIVTLALGIAATVTVFSFVNSVYLRPLAVPEGSRLVHIQAVTGPDNESNLSFPVYRILARGTKSFDRVAAHYSTSPLYLTARDEAGEVEGAVVSAEYFPMLGLRPALGRFFLSSEDSVPDRDAVAVLGHGLWMSRFGGARSVLGERVTINGRSFTVIGVAPEGFDGVVGGIVNRLWIPAMMMHTGYRWCDGFLATCPVTSIMARLAPGATLDDARREIGVLTPSIIAATDPTDSIRMVSVDRAVGVRDHEQRLLMNLSKLLGAIAIILMIVACANLSGLLLARGLTRQREIALRTSLGASRGRVVRQLLTENLLVAAAGGGLGVAISVLTSRLLVGFFATDDEGYAHRYDVSLDSRVLAFALVASALAVMFFGLIPAIRGSTINVAEALKSGGEGVRGSRARARTALVTGQVVLSTTLLIGAVMLTRSVGRLMTSNAFDPSHVAQVRLRPRLVGYNADSGQSYVRRAVAAIRATPGVRSVAPVNGSVVRMNTGMATIALPGDMPVSRDKAPRVDYFDVGPDYFATLRVPLTAGREFTARDDAASPFVVIVTESLASRMWPRGGAVGRPLLLNGKLFRVVGVVKDHRVLRFGESVQPSAYVAYWQSVFEPQIDARLVIGVEGDPIRALPAIRRAAASADRRVPVTEPLSMAVQMSASFVQVRLGRAVLMAGAALALFLSVVGLYGVVAFLVAQRRREIGVRMAVGASPSNVVGLFVWRGLRPILLGLDVGLGVSFVAAPLLSQWLFGIPPIDRVSILIATAAVGVAGLLATYVPARRAARTDPAAVFRCD